MLAVLTARLVIAAGASRATGAHDDRVPAGAGLRRDDPRAVALLNAAPLRDLQAPLLPPACRIHHRLLSRPGSSCTYIIIRYISESVPWSGYS